MISEIIFVTLVILQVLDIWTTKKCLSLGGIEANPVMKYLIDQFGFLYSMVGMKVLVIITSYFAIDTILPAVLSFIYIIVIVNNIRVLRSLSKE